MNKLNGTSGQLFSAIAETVNGRMTAKSAKGSGKQAAENSSFHDLLHTVSNRGRPPKRPSVTALLGPTPCQASGSDVCARTHKQAEEIMFR